MESLVINTSLVWSCVGSLKELLQNQVFDVDFIRQFSRPGLYLWTETQQDELSSYVGKTRSNLIHRNLDHFGYFTSLRYSIPRCYHPEGLRYVAEDPSRYSKERGYDAVLSPALLTEERYQQIFAMMLDYWQNLTVYFAPFDDLQNLAALEKQVISDLLPVENISATASPYATYCIDYQGDLPAAKVAALRRAASQQLLLDPTRPSKARYYLKQAVS